MTQTDAPRANPAQTKKAPNRKAAKRGGGSGFFSLLLVAIPAAVISPGITMIVLIGLIPTFVANIIDRDPSKPTAIAVGAINLCGVLPFVIDLWKHGITMVAAQHLLADPLTLLVMYGAAAVGWAFVYAVPPIVASFEVMRAEGRIEQLHGKKRSLIEEWGPEVALDDEALERKLKAGASSGAASG